MLNNTTAFTPVGDYNSATKKYVDACYGPNNPPPYPVTSVNGQNWRSENGKDNSI